MENTRTLLVMPAVAALALTALTPSASAQGPAAPAVGQSVNLRPLSGRVYVRVPGAPKGRGVRLQAATQVPVGSFIDTRRGRVSLTAALDKAGEQQNGVFSQGRFRVSQSARPQAKGLVTMTLTGGNTRICQAGQARRRRPPIRRGRSKVNGGRWKVDPGKRYGVKKSGLGAQAAASAPTGIVEWDTLVFCKSSEIRVRRGTLYVRGRRSVRRLRAGGRGRFRVRGRHSAATVRG